MKKMRFAIRPLPMPECVIGLAPAVRALKQVSPGCEVGLFAEEPLREASLLVPDLDFFLTDGDETQADHLIDLRSGAGRGVASPGWVAYTAACAAGLGAGNPYHLADLLRKAADLDTVDVSFELATPEPADSLPAALTKSGALRVAVCTSSLSEASLEAVLDGLSQVRSPAEVFLLGAFKDQAKAARAAGKPREGLMMHDLCGRQRLAADAAALQGCDIAIAGPGLRALLSSGFGTFTVCVDEEPARGPLLYPYGHGHLVIQRPAAAPLATVLAPLLSDILGYALGASGGSVPTVDQWQTFGESMIFSYIGKARLLAVQRVETLLRPTGSFTELYLRPLLFAGSEVHDVLQTFYRLLWEHSLNGRDIASYDIQLLHQDTMPLLCDLLKPLEQLYELGNFGRIYSGYVRESLSAGDIAKAKHESARLQEVEELMQALVSSQPFLAPLLGFHREAQQAMDAASPIALAAEMTSLFSGLQSRVLVMLDLARTLFHTVFENERVPGPGAEEGGS